MATDILDKIETSDGITGQKPADFKIEGSNKVKDEIARAWADAQSYWGIFKRKLLMLRFQKVSKPLLSFARIWDGSFP